MSPTKAENTDTKHRYRNTGRKHRHRNHINIAYKPIQSLCQKAPLPLLILLPLMITIIMQFVIDEDIGNPDKKPWK